MGEIAASRFSARSAELQPPSNTLVDEIVVERRHLSLLRLGVADDGVQFIVGQRVKVELDEAVTNHVCHCFHLLGNPVEHGYLVSYPELVPKSGP